MWSRRCRVSQAGFLEGRKQQSMAVGRRPPQGQKEIGGTVVRKREHVSEATSAGNDRNYARHIVRVCGGPMSCIRSEALHSV